MRRLLLLGMLIALAGCGNDERTAAPPSQFTTSTSLVITVDLDGRGPAPPKTRRCEGAACAPVPADAFKPVRPRQACTDIYGGPQTATIEGTLRGARVGGRFSRRNGCEITRWDLAKPLLEP